MVSSAVALFRRNIEVSGAIRDEPKTRYVAKIVGERTSFFLKLVEVVYFVLAPGVFVVFDFLGHYDGPWWVPYLVNVPAVIAGLYFLGYLQVIRHQWNVVQDGTNDVLAAKYEGSEYRFSLSGHFAVEWPIVATLISIVSVGGMGWNSLLFIAGVPELAFVSVLAFGSRVTRW